MDEKRKFLKSFEEKLKKNLDKEALRSLSGGDDLDDGDIVSYDYEQFRLESLPKSYSKYEKLCNFSEKILNVKAGEKDKPKIERNLYISHLNCTSTGVVSAGILVCISLVLLGGALALYSILIGVGIVLLGLLSYLAFLNIPKIAAQLGEAKANDQVINAIFYIVAFMRFSPNIERAIYFAAEYLKPPLSLDFKRLLWDLDNAKYPTIKRALDKYLERWRDRNLEFLESIYLIESSLYESEEFRRLSLLDKSLDIILQGNYERAVHFAQELREKANVFNMLGVVLPILGLIILPLAASFSSPKTVFNFMVVSYNIFLPFIIGYYGFVIVSSRPSSISSITTKNISDLKRRTLVPLKLSKKKKILVPPKIFGIVIFSVFFLIGIFPIVAQSLVLGTVEIKDENGISRNETLTLAKKLDPVFGSLAGENKVANEIIGTFQEEKSVGKGDDNDKYPYGPYGIIPGILSVFLTLSFAFGAGYYLRLKYKQLIKLRDATKRLEDQFPSSSFQLGNRINEGISAELAFGAVADTMKGTESGKFFILVDKKIKFSGMSVKRALFDEQEGALLEYPSETIISSMKIFVKAVEKGPEIAARTLIELSRYLTEIHLAQERLKDLLAESLGSMKSQSSFLAPVISSVVISIVHLITFIMGKLSEDISSTGVDQAGDFLGDGIPTYLFQSSVGIYIIILIATLVFVVTNLEFGEDPILTKYEIGNRIIRGMKLYGGIAIFGIISFTVLIANVLPTT